VTPNLVNKNTSSVEPAGPIFRVQTEDDAARSSEMLVIIISQITQKHIQKNECEYYVL